MDSLIASPVSVIGDRRHVGTTEPVPIPAPVILLRSAPSSSATNAQQGEQHPAEKDEQRHDIPHAPCNDRR